MGADIPELREEDTLGIMPDPFMPAPAADCRHAIELKPIVDILKIEIIYQWNMVVKNIFGLKVYFKSIFSQCTVTIF